ncbi:MAG: PspC domain-containing protein [Actinomycetota bacterium]|nr:PspC domain-containing protein [Actinomycetota bacterium]
MSTSSQSTGSRQLRRPIEGRAIAGVAAGLGQRFDISPTWFRVAFILMTVFGGIGLLLYAIGWLLIPEEGSDEPIVAQWLSDFDTSNTGMVVGVVLIGIAAIILASSFHLISGRFVFAAILLVVGVLLYRGDLDRRSGPPDGENGEPPPTGGSDHGIYSESVEVEKVEEVDDGLIVADVDVSEAVVESRVGPPPPPARPPRPKSILGRLTVAATLIALGGLAMLDAAGVLFPDPVHYVAVTVGVIGAGLLVGALFGRARWLIVVGLLLTPLLFLASIGPTWSISGEAGERHVRVESIQDFERVDFEYEHGAGVLEIDLREFQMPAEAGIDNFAISFRAKIGAGEIRIYLPEGAGAVVTGKAGIGSVDVLGYQSAGIGVSRTAETLSPGGRPIFEIEAKAGVGSVVVTEFNRIWEG